MVNENWKKIFYEFFVLISSAMLRSSYFNFVTSFQINLFLTNFTQLPFSNRHEKATPFMDFSVNGKRYFQILSYKLSVITSFALLHSSFFNFLRSFQIILLSTIFTQMPFLYRYQKTTFSKEISVNGKKNEKQFLKFFRHYFFCIATFKLLQFLTIISDISVFNDNYSNALFRLTREIYFCHGIFRKC